MADIFLTSENSVRTLMNIDDNVQSKTLLPSIREAQQIDLQGVIGTNLLTKLQELIRTGEIAEDENAKYKLILDNYIQYFLAYKTTARLCMVTNFKIGNIGVAQTNDENINSVSLKDTITIQNYYTDKADFYVRRLQDYLIDHYNEYPEMTNDQISQMKANLHSAANNSGFFLGGARGKKSPWRHYHKHIGYDRPNED